MGRLGYVVDRVGRDLVVALSLGKLGLASAQFTRLLGVSSGNCPLHVDRFVPFNLPDRLAPAVAAGGLDSGADTAARQRKAKRMEPGEIDFWIAVDRGDTVGESLESDQGSLQSHLAEIGCRGSAIAGIGSAFSDVWDSAE